MGKIDKLPLTRQGVRDLNSLGTPVRQTLRKRWTCPPHLPADRWERDYDGFFTEVLRRRSCRAILDSRLCGGY